MHGNSVKKMAEITNSTVGYIALLRQLAFFARLGQQSLDDANIFTVEVVA